MAYAEIYITETLWPDFDRNEQVSPRALCSYQQRDRRFWKSIIMGSAKTAPVLYLADYLKERCRCHVTSSPKAEYNRRKVDQYRDIVHLASQIYSGYTQQ